MAEIKELFNFKQKPEWIRLAIRGMEDAEFLLAPLENTDHRARFERIMSERVPDPQFDLRSTEEKEKDFCETLVGTVLLDWRGLTSSGEEFPFNETNAMHLLCGSTAFREEIVRRSRLMKTQKEKEEMELSDNLEK